MKSEYLVDDVVVKGSPLDRIVKKLDAVTYGDSLALPAGDLHDVLVSIGDVQAAKDFAMKRPGEEVDIPVEAARELVAKCGQDDPPVVAKETATKGNTATKNAR